MRRTPDTLREELTRHRAALRVLRYQYQQLGEKIARLEADLHFSAAKYVSLREPDSRPLRRIQRRLRLIRRRGCAVAIMVLWASLVSAQEMNYSVDWFFVGATNPFMSSGMVADETACDPTAVLPSVPNNVVNPGWMWWEHDPDGSGPLPVWVCAIDITSLVRPFTRGSYFARLRAVDPVLPDEPSLESPNSNPFVAAAVPLAPGAVVITQ